MGISDPSFEEFNNAVDGLFGPTPVPELTATLRVAVLYDSNSEVRQAAERAGMAVVRTSAMPSDPADGVDFDSVPTFHLLLVNLPGDSRNVLEFALRFLRVRRPAAFVLTGKERIDTGLEFERFFRGRAEQVHYQLHSATLRARDGDTRSFVAGMSPRIAFSWPLGDPVDASDADMLVLAVLEQVGHSVLLRRT